MNSPLNERDFAEIRSNVLREIARRQKRNAFVLAGAVAFAVLALVFVLIPKNHAGGGAGAPLRTAPAQAALPVLSGAPAPSPVQTVASTQPPKIHHHKRHHPKPTPPPIAIASAEEQQPITIELQTANPDVRIIWIGK